ncbi:MAG: MmgE/PrpD family protein [Deltaproteobacteria bacterium]|nr:MmgE/PrpD family protein [Deltaproteobacteria bacterium]
MTRTLARFAAELQYADLPAAAIEKAREITLHGWGVQLAGSTLPWSGSIYRYVQGQGGRPESTVLNYGLRTSAGHAAFANGTFGHGFEMDDNHAETGLKGGCVMIPTVLAMGERQRSTGRECLLATVIGFEIATRIARSVVSLGNRKSHHPTGIAGPFGAAAAAGKLLQFGEEAMLHALSIAAGHSAGLNEAPATGRGSLKRIFGGMAAANGIRSALLAEEGLTGPETMLEGKKGFCRTFSDEPDLSALTAGLGSEWQILKVHYKLYAQDGYIQPMTEALDRLVKRHRFSPAEVAKIRAGVSRHACEVAGQIREPADLTSAQFSANFSLALFLVKGGAGFQEYTAESLTDPAISDLSRRIDIEVDEAIEAEWQRTKPRGARVTVQLRSGERFAETVPSLRPLTTAEVEEKFRRLATVAISEKKAEQLLERVGQLEAEQDLSRVVSLLTA